MTTGRPSSSRTSPLIPGASGSRVGDPVLKHPDARACFSISLLDPGEGRPAGDYNALRKEPPASTPSAAVRREIVASAADRPEAREAYPAFAQSFARKIDLKPSAPTRQGLTSSTRCGESSKKRGD